MREVYNNQTKENLLIEDFVFPTLPESVLPQKRVYKGDYYNEGDVVKYQNNLYKCISAYRAYSSDTNKPDTDTTHWEKLSGSYLKLTNGLIIQWGFEPTGSQQRVVNQKITFPIAFSNTNYSLTVTPNTWQSDTIHRIGWIGSNKLSETQAWINFYGNGNQDTIDGINWLAIGF